MARSDYVICDTCGEKMAYAPDDSDTKAWCQPCHEKALEQARALIAEIKRLRKAEAFLCKQLPSLARAFEFGDSALSGGGRRMSNKTLQRFRQIANRAKQEGRLFVYGPEQVIELLDEHNQLREHVEKLRRALTSIIDYGKALQPNPVHPVTFNACGIAYEALQSDEQEG